MLSWLGLHYPRPEMTREQSKLFVQSYLASLSPYSVQQVRDACQKWLENGSNHWFPTPGQLLDLLRPEPSERHAKEPYKAPLMIEERRGKPKSVAEILRSHGFSTAGWEK